MQRRPLLANWRRAWRECPAPECYLPSFSSAVRIGALEIWIMPENGRSNSKMRKTALETASALIAKVMTTVGLGGAKRLKLAKSRASQATITTKKGSGIELPFCENSVQRSLAVSMAIETA